jgi:hypothetical protein
MGEPGNHVALADVVGGLAAIGLEELEARAALQRRTDRKYVLPTDRLELLTELRDDHLALEIEGRRLSAYDSVYFDTPDLRCYADHVAGRRPRFKIRSRLYAETGVCSLEIKIAQEVGETAKHHLDYAERDHGTLTPEGRDFVAETLGDQAPAELGPTLRTTFRRATIAARDGDERITADADLRLARPDGASMRLRDDLVLVEAKSADGDAPFDRLMQSAGIEEVSLSKYKTGIGLLVADDDVGPAARCFVTAARQ